MRYRDEVVDGGGVEHLPSDAIAHHGGADPLACRIDAGSGPGRAGTHDEDVGVGERADVLLGGIETDADGRALRADGSVIEGLYAAGNTSAPVMGHTYAGPGATIGPALVFGYLAALDIAAQAKTPAAAATTTTEV